MLVPPFPTAAPPTPRQAQRVPGKGAGHGQLTPCAPLKGSGLEVQEAGVWLPSRCVPSRPGQPVPSSSEELVERRLPWLLESLPDFMFFSLYDGTWHVHWPTWFLFTTIL